MRRHLGFGTICGAMLAPACHTPLGAAPAAATKVTSARGDWPSPPIGRTFTLLPTPRTVAWGWYDAAGEPVVHVSSGDEVIVRALSTCSPQSLVRAGLDSTRVEQLAKDIYAARASMKTGPGGHVLTGPIFVEGA